MQKLKSIWKAAKPVCIGVLFSISILVISLTGFLLWQTLEENKDLQRFVTLSQLDFDSRTTEAANAIKTVMADSVEDADRFKYSALIVKYAMQYNLDHLDVIAVIKHESNFQVNAVSETGDYGLMQVNWYWVGRHYYKDKKELLDIENNIKLGCEQLMMWREHVRKVKGKKVDVFNHYNSGYVIESNSYGRKVSAIRKKL